MAAGDAAETASGAPDASPAVADDGSPTEGRKRRRVQSCAEGGVGSRLLMQGLALIPKVPQFADIEACEHPRLVGAFTIIEHEPGQVIVRQGEPGRELLIIDGGRAALKIIGPSNHWAAAKPVQVGVLNSGDSLGEAGLLHDMPWSATVQALDALRAWKLERTDFGRLGLRHKLRFKRRMAVHNFSVHGGAEPTSGPGPSDLDVRPTTDAERAFLRRALLANPVLGPLVRLLSEAELDMLIRQAWRQQVQQGTEVVRQGELKVDLLYVVEQGSFVVIEDCKLVERLGPGGSFGERALLYREPFFSTVRASSDATLWKLRRQEFRGVERALLQRKLDESAALLRRVALLRDTPQAEIQQLADALVEVAFRRGERILRQGEVGRALLILYQGAVTVEVERPTGLEISRLAADPETSQAHFFGEQALLHDLQSPSSVVAASEGAVALVLDRDVFLHVTRPATAAGAPTGVFCSACQTPLALPSRICHVCESAPSLSISGGFNLRDGESVRLYQREELEEVGLLGCGRFARVSLVRCRPTGHVFALKTVSKGLVIEYKQEQSVMVEKTILRTTQSPFLIRLVATFSSERHFHFLLEAALGGDLLTACERADFFGSDEHARFYVACVLRGLEHLHERYIIYRDLKMENVMLDAAGYAKLTDFGLSKFVIGHTYTRCGTPDYMAPEMITGEGHTSAVDWWALGVLTYALMEGSLPFDASESCLIFWKVQSGIELARFTDASAPWAQLVRDLCKKEPRERLPVRAGGARGVFEHPWFVGANFNWSAMDRREMPAPYKPSVDGPLDVQNFSANAEDAPKESEHYVDAGAGWSADFEDPRGPVSLD